MLLHFVDIVFLGFVFVNQTIWCLLLSWATSPSATVVVTVVSCTLDVSAQWRNLETTTSNHRLTIDRDKNLLKFTSVTKKFYLEFVLLAVVLNSSVFCDITPYSPLKVNRCFGRDYRLHFQGRRITRTRNHLCFPPAFMLLFSLTFSWTWKWRGHVPPKTRG
jgi:hypothetical protein